MTEQSMRTSLAGPLQGAPNFRGMEGVALADGGRLAPGRVFRSGSLHDLTPDDLRHLDGLSIATLCDLRSQMERDRFPSLLPDGSRALRMNLEINRDARAGDNDFMRIIRADPSANGAKQGMIHNYQWFPQAFEGHLATFFDRLVDAEGAPMVFHCHAGKDRTGFVAAMLLLALGAPRDAVIDDYMKTIVISGDDKIAELTGVFRDLAGVELDAQAVLPVLEVYEDYLDASLKTINAQYGSLDDYLAKAGGLTPVRRDKLRQNLAA